MPELLPMFPLNLVAFPKEVRGLYIFEERYKQLINECREQGTTFGIPVVLGRQLAEIGTEVRLASIDDVSPGGEMNITIEGMRRFRIVSFREQAVDKLYPVGEVEWLPEDPSTKLDVQKEVLSLVTKLHRLLDSVKMIEEAPADIWSYTIANNIGLNFEQKYELLSSNDEEARLRFIQDHLEKELQKLKAKFNGHFENLILPDM